MMTTKKMVRDPYHGSSAMMMRQGLLLVSENVSRGLLLRELPEW